MHPHRTPFRPRVYLLRSDYYWLAFAIPRFEAEATIARVRGFDVASEGGLERLFLDARERDYQG